MSNEATWYKMKSRRVATIGVQNEGESGDTHSTQLNPEQHELFYGRMSFIYCLEWSSLVSPNNIA